MVFFVRHASLSRIPFISPSTTVFFKHPSLTLFSSLSYKTKDYTELLQPKILELPPPYLKPTLFSFSSLSKFSLFQFWRNYKQLILLRSPFFFFAEILLYKQTAVGSTGTGALYCSKIRMGCGCSMFLKKLVAEFLASGDCPSG